METDLFLIAGEPLLSIPADFERPLSLLSAFTAHFRLDADNF